MQLGYLFKYTPQCVPVSKERRQIRIGAWTFLMSFVQLAEAMSCQKGPSLDVRSRFNFSSLG